MAYDRPQPPASTTAPPDVDVGTNHDVDLPTADWQSRVAPTLDAAEWLIDWLEATGHTIVYVELRRPGEFVVTWR